MATPGHPSLRLAIAESLLGLTERVPAAEIARWLGVATSTITRREGKLDGYPSSDLLVLAAHDRALADSLRLFLDGQVIDGDGRQVEGDASGDIGRNATEIGADHAALVDGILDRAECFSRRHRLAQRRDLLDREIANIDDRLRSHA